MPKLQDRVSLHTTIIAACLQVSCSGPGQPAAMPVPIQIGKGIHATVQVSYGQSRAVSDANLFKLFDGNSETSWSSADDECQLTFFSIYADIPVFIKEITLVSRGKAKPLKAGVVLGYSRDASGDGIGAVDMAAKLFRRETQTLEVGKDPYFQILNGRSIDLWVEGCSAGKGKFEISEIKFDLVEATSFVPEFDIKKLESKIDSVAKHEVAGQAGWHFKDDYNEVNKKTYLAHLMYYGLHGDRDAEKIFESYAPTSAELGEDMSDLKAWYYELKK